MTTARQQTTHPTTTRPPVNLTETERLDRARRSEASTRPVTAEVYVSPITRGAVLRLLGASGQAETERNVIRLDGAWTSEGGPVRQAAADKIHERGYRLNGGWDVIDDDTARTPIEPTGEYLAYVARKFGPAPDLPELPAGMVAHRTHRGRWSIGYQNRRFWDLTWQPVMAGEVWRIWTGPQRTKLHGPYDSAAAAIASLDLR
ncbi:hypothetical protein ACWGQ5_55100 [Streptomyces sp. NPDC055722]